MTTDEMISAMQAYLGNIGTILDSQILVELQLAQTQCERGPIWPAFLKDQRQYLTTADEPRVQLPAGFLKEVENDALYVLFNGDYIALKKDYLQDLRDEFEGVSATTAGVTAPTYYALEGNYFWIYPTPSETVTLRMHYYKQDTTLALGNSNNWSTYYPDLLMGLAGQNLSSSFRAPEIKPRFDEMVMVARRQMLQHETGREVANMEQSYGGG